MLRWISQLVVSTPKVDVLESEEPSFREVEVVEFHFWKHCFFWKVILTKHHWNIYQYLYWPCVPRDFGSKKVRSTKINICGNSLFSTMDSTKTIALNIVQAKTHQALTTFPLSLIQHMNHFLSIFKHSSLLEFQSITNLNTPSITHHFMDFSVTDHVLLWQFDTLAVVLKLPNPLQWCSGLTPENQPSQFGSNQTESWWIPSFSRGHQVTLLSHCWSSKKKLTDHVTSTCVFHLFSMYLSQSLVHQCPKFSYHPCPILTEALRFIERFSNQWSHRGGFACTTLTQKH